jgi:hypothetical protein
MFDDQEGGGGGSGSGGGTANWEWTADVDNGLATKRGFATCDDISAHEVDVDAYDFRCCAPKS